MGLGKDYQGQDCSMARTLELVGERWTLLIVRDAFYGVRRYSDFLTHLRVPRAVLSERLAALTAAGILDRRRYSESPPRDEYVLTEMGLDLWPVIRALSAFGSRHLAPDGPWRLYLHSDCGTEVDGSSRCPTCDVVVRPNRIEMRLGPGAEQQSRDAVDEALRSPRRLLDPLVH